MATGSLPRTATFSAMFSASAVFPMRRPRRQNNQFRRLQAGSQVVELGVAGGKAGDALAFAENLREALEIVADQSFTPPGQL